MIALDIFPTRFVNGFGPKGFSRSSGLALCAIDDCEVEPRSLDAAVDSEFEAAVEVEEVEEVVDEVEDDIDELEDEPCWPRGG